MSLILWFILDDEKSPTFYFDGDKVYAVRDVIRVNDLSMNLDCGEEGDESDMS